jgi:ATP-dependent Clp endopeptidase proteolytic subunit ClpP
MQKNIHINQLTNNAAEVIIYGYIGEAVLSGDVIKAIRALEPLNTKITFRINSGGGSIFEGLAIFNAIKNCQCDTEAYIDGLAASMGSVIAMACKKIYMSKYAMFMTHRAKGGTTGSAQDMRTTATLMESLENTMATIYAERTGMTTEDAAIKYLGKDDRWLTADEAKAEHIIDGIYDGELSGMPPIDMRTEKELCGFYASTYNLEKFTTDMKEIKLTAEQATYLGATSNEPMHMQAVLDGLIGKAQKVDALEASLTATNAKLVLAEAKIKTAEAAGRVAEITAIIKDGVNSKKMTVEMGAQLATDYAEKPDELKKLVAALPVFASVVSAINTSTASKEALANKTWDEMDKDGTLEKCKAETPVVFKAKFQEKFGKEYAG